MDYKVTIQLSEKESKIIAKAMSLYYEKLAEHHLSIQLTEGISKDDKDDYTRLMYRAQEINQFLMDELLPKFDEQRTDIPSFAKL